MNEKEKMAGVPAPFLAHLAATTDRTKLSPEGRALVERHEAESLRVPVDGHASPQPLS